MGYDGFMGIISFLILGGIAGSVARLLVPGRIGPGLIPAIICGVVGALVGGILSSEFLGIGLGGLFNLRTWAIAIAGSALVLVVYGALHNRKKR